MKLSLWCAGYKFGSINLSFFVAGFVRPVVLLGPIADITRDKLLQEMPETFAIPSECFSLLSILYLDYPFNSQNQNSRKIPN